MGHNDKNPSFPLACWPPRGFATLPLTFLHAFGSQGTPTLVALSVNYWIRAATTGGA